MIRHTGCGAVTAVMDGSARDLSAQERDPVVDQVTRRNVAHTVATIQERSTVIHQAVNFGTIHVVRAIYDLRSSQIKFLHEA